MTAGVNSTIISTVIVGLVSQVWLRNRHPVWYTKYNYILGGAFDAGAQVMIFLLSFAVFGAAGTSRPFPNVRELSFYMFFTPSDFFLSFFSVGRKSGSWECRLL
jgi:hypothetical protein